MARRAWRGGGVAAVAWLAAWAGAAGCGHPGGGERSGAEEGAAAAVSPASPGAAEASGDDTSNDPARADVGPGGRWGYVDLAGSMVIAPLYAEAGHFSDGLAAVSQRRRWGYIDEAGGEVIAPRYSAAGPFAEGLAPVAIGDRWGYVDAAGTMVISDRFAAARPFSGGLAAVAGPDGLWGFVDGEGELLIAFQFDEVGALSDGRAPARVGERWGYIDAAGDWVLSPRYAGARVFSGGLAAVENEPGGGWCYIDPAGAVAIAGPFAEAGAFSEGVAFVRRSDGGSGYIAGDGEWAVRGPFDRGTPFADDVAAVRVDGLWGLIDRGGALVSPARHARAGAVSHGRWAVFVPYDHPYTDAAGERHFLPDPSRALVDVTAVEVEGYRSEDRAREYVARQRAGLRACYRNHLLRMSPIEGSLVIRIHSEPGLPSRRSEVVESTLDDPDLERCMAGRLRRGQPGPGAAGAEGGTATIHVTLRYGTPPGSDAASAEVAGP